MVDAPYVLSFKFVGTVPSPMSGIMTAVLVLCLLSELIPPPTTMRQGRIRPPREGEHAQGQITADLFSEFNGIPKGADKTEFYAHDQNWSNRMILGDSLQVMASLAVREGLRGRVRCIYFDPPYGIKFNSNLQWSTTSRDVKDGTAPLTFVHQVTGTFLPKPENPRRRTKPEKVRRF